MLAFASLKKLIKKYLHLLLLVLLPTVAVVLLDSGVARVVRGDALEGEGQLFLSLLSPEERKKLGAAFS